MAGLDVSADKSDLFMRHVSMTNAKGNEIRRPVEPPMWKAAPIGVKARLAHGMFAEDGMVTRAHPATL
jgi:hypothetical protein